MAGKGPTCIDVPMIRKRPEKLVLQTIVALFTIIDILPGDAGLGESTITLRENKLGI